jgi:hypothetical protein
MNQLQDAPVFEKKDKKKKNKNKGQEETKNEIRTVTQVAYVKKNPDPVKNPQEKKEKT